MSIYEDLTEGQKKLYDTLKDAIENEQNITPILEEIKKEGVLREVLTTANITKKLKDGTEYNLTPLGYAMNFNNFEEIIKVIVEASEDKKEVLTTANITEKLKDGTEYNLTPLGLAMNLNDEGGIKAILDEVQKNSALEELLNSMKENDPANLKKILETFKNQEQNEEHNNKKDAVKTANQSIIIGSICGVIAALAVGGGCFAAGVALPKLALIGIAVAAAVLTGLVAGGITYEVCKPCNELNEVDSQLEGCLNSVVK